MAKTFENLNQNSSQSVLATYKDMSLVIISGIEDEVIHFYRVFEPVKGR